MNTRRLAMLILLSLVAGCEVMIPVRVHPVFMAERGNQTLALPVGEPMRTDDRVAAVLQVDQPAHVYVFQLVASGGPIRMYPEEDDERLAARLPLRIPARGSFTTTPNLVIIVHTVPLSASEQLRRVEKASRKPRQKQVGQSHHPIILRDAKGPPGSIGERSGEELRRIAGALGTTAAVDSDGATLRVWLTSE